MNVGSPEINSQVLEVFRFGAIAGFITAATLVINLNVKAYDKVFRRGTKLYFIFFLLLGLVPLGVILYFFSLFFGKLW